MDASMPFDLFQSASLIWVPLGIVMTFALLLIPSLLVTGAKPEAAAKAIGCTILKAVGFLLIAMSAVDLTLNLIAMKLPEFPTLASLIFLFCLGLGIMVHQSKVMAKIDDASSIVARMVFSHTCEILGALITLYAALSLALSFLFTQELIGWEPQASLLLLGVILMLTSGIHISKHKRKAARKAK